VRGTGELVLLGQSSFNWGSLMSAAQWTEESEPSKHLGSRAHWYGAHRWLQGTTSIPPLGKVLTTSVAYFLLARLGVALGIPPDGISIFWPPNAIILSTFLILPRSQWWAFGLGFLCAEVASDVPTFPIVEAVGYGAVNCFEGALSAFILRRFLKDDFGLSTPRELFYFILVAVVVVPGIAALGGAAIYVLGGSNEDYVLLWRTWWFGDAVGLAAFAPILLVLWRRYESGISSVGLAYWLELALALAILAAAAGVAFKVDWLSTTEYYRLFYVYPVLAWIALRSQVLGAAAASAVTACIVSWMAVIGEIPLGATGRFQDVLFLQQFLVVTNLSTLTLAVLVQQMAVLNRKLGVQLEQERSRNEIMEAKLRAERANEAKSTFLAHMSHELRTPLNAIIGFAGAIRAETFGPINNARYDEYIVDIEESAQHLLSLINDVIDIARIEGGKLELSEDAVEPSATIEQVFRMLKSSASKKHIRFNNLCQPQLPKLRCDEIRVRQVLINLVGNAVKFSPEGSDIDVSAIHDGGILKFVVRDHGAGIPADRVNRAFDRFQQFSEDPHVRAQGSGLGLHVSRMLMEAHNGRISIESELGQGTTVTLAFPKERVLFA
jgi:signal transduction histidine kinase